MTVRRKRVAALAAARKELVDINLEARKISWEEYYTIRNGKWSDIAPMK